MFREFGSPRQAESELAVLTAQCLNRRIPDKKTLEKEVAAGEPTETNITPKARVKLRLKGHTLSSNVSERMR